MKGVLLIAGIFIAGQLGQAALNNQETPNQPTAAVAIKVANELEIAAEPFLEQHTFVADIESQSSVLVGESEPVYLADTEASADSSVDKDQPTAAKICCWYSGCCEMATKECPPPFTRVPCPCPKPSVTEEGE